MTDEEKQLLGHRYELAVDSIEHAKLCIQDHRGDLALKAMEIAARQIQKLKPA